MSERVLYLIILVSYIAFAGLYIFWINPAKEKRYRAYQEAVKVARFFGEKDFELVNFKEDSGGIYVFVDKKNESHYYAVGRWTTNFKNSQKETEKYVNNVCSLFPSYISRREDYRTYDQFRQEAHRENY